MMDDRRSGSTSVFVNKSGASNGAYGLAFVGAAIYNLQHATSFWSGVVGFFEAVVWPALLLYKLLRFLDR